MGAWLLSVAATAQVAPRQREALPDIDVRIPPPVAAAPAARSATLVGSTGDAVSALRQQVPDARVDRDELHGAPSFVRSTSRFLTGSVPAAALRAAPAAPVQPQAQNATQAIVGGFVDEHAALFGHRSDALANARLRRDYTGRSGLRTLVWEQRVDDIRVYGGIFQAHVTARGELVNVASRFIANPEQAAERGTPARLARLAAPTVSALEAVATAARDVGTALSASQVIAQDVTEGAEKRQSFRADGLAGAQAHLVWLPMDASTLRLGWEVVFTSKARGEMFRTVVDAETGRVQVRQNLTSYISNATYRVFTGDSPSPFSPGHATPLTTQPAEVARTLVTTPALNTTASPSGWIDDGVMETRGNNVDAHADTNADDLPDLPRPQASGAARVFDPPLNLTQSPAGYRDAAVVNLFYWCNWMHDRLYELGFTEAAGNFQNNNFSRGGFGNDAVEADAQDGSGTSNANFSTPPDGSPGRMQMYVFDSPSPARDGDLDAEIILHEYTHGLSNRLVGGGAGISALQARGMGEGWSDFYALALLSQAGDDPAGNYASGGYSTYFLGGQLTNYYFGIRRYPYSTNLTKNPLTFRDIDPAQASAHAGVPRSGIVANTATSVHNMGEVWCATLWEARANLIAKHGFAIGNELILQLVTDGMKLSPVDPNFLEARDAILQADLVATGGANHRELWAAFAKRGMGANARSPASSTTTGVVENQDLPDDLDVSPANPTTMSGTVGGPFKPATVTFTLTNTGTSSLTWTATDAVAWLDLGAASGSLAPGASAAVVVSANAASTSLPAGTQGATITVTNTTSGVAQTRALTLEVEPFTVPIFTDTFESGSLDPARWTTSGNGPWRTQVTTANAPHGGTRHLTMDSAFEGSYARNEATLSLNLTGERNLVLKFWAKIFSDEGDAPASNPFTGGANFDGVAISANGTTWYEVQPLRGPAVSNSWAPFTVDLDAAIAARGLSYGSAFKIRFNQYDNFGIPTDGLAIDDVSVVRVINNRLALTLPAAVNESASPVAVTVTATPTPPASLVVTLSSSVASLLGLPATVTIPAGMNSATFNLTPVDDALLNGSRPVTIGATASGWTGASGNVVVQDNETATLTVTLPATTSEGTADVTGTVTVSRAPAVDVLVTLASSDVTEVQPPPTVTIPAGQTSATFALFVNDDNRIDGDHDSVVTATVANWTPGSATITVRDNESRAIALVAPTAVREGDTGITGTVRIAGILAAPLVVTLVSDDTTELTVPASVTIPAGQTTASFVITVVDDTLADGAQTARITASATNFTAATGAVTVADNDAHHFAISPIGVTQVRHAPFAVTVTAQDINNVAITNYDSPVTLTAASGGTPVAATPATLGAGAFASGVWTGNVTVAAFATNVVLTAADAGGHAGASNPFTVGTGPLHHFGWSALTAPLVVDTPFAVTVTAQDVGNNPVTTFNGAVELGVKPQERVDILAWTGYADMSTGGEYENAKRAISTYFTNYNITTSTTTDPAVLAGQLAGRQVFLVPEQEGAYSGVMSALGTAWATTLGMFVNGGGTIIACSWLADEHALFTTSGLMTATKDATPGADTLTKVADTPLNVGVATPFSGSYIATYSGTNGTVSLKSTSDNNAVVFSRDVGAGRVIMIGTDFYTLGTGMDRVLANAVSGAAVTGTTIVPVRPGSATFTNGGWTGSVSVPITGSGVQLVATDAGGSSGLSARFDVVRPGPPPNGGAVVFSEDFESGALSAAWSVTGTSTFRTQVTTQYGPHGGARHLTMDNSAGATGARNEATVALNLAGRRNVVLSFWAKGFDDDSHGPPSLPFPASGADFDGVAISADGINWYEVQGLRYPALANAWTRFVVDLDAALSSHGLTFTSNFRIRFNQYDDSPIPTDGIAFDDIQVTATPDGLPMTLALPAQAIEGATGVTGTVTLAATATSAVTANLTSSGPAKASVPAQVTIAAGQTTASFTVTLPDDPLVDGDRSVAITATAPGYTASTATLSVLDNDAPALALTLPASLTEGGPQKMATLAATGRLANPLTIALTSSDATVTLPASVTIPLGTSSVQFPLRATNDNRIEGPVTVTIGAALGSAAPVTGRLVVEDDEDTSLAISLPTSLREGDAPKQGSVQLRGVLATDVVVTIASSDPTELTVPAILTIPAGQTVANFSAGVVDDPEADGTQSVTLTATATVGSTASTASITRQVRDNDAHHFTFATVGSPMVVGGPVPAIVTARDAAGAAMKDYNSTIVLSATSGGAPVALTPTSASDFVNGVWNGSVVINTAATNVVLAASDGQGHTGASNAFDLVAGSLDRFVWDPIPAAQAIDTPFNVRVRAVDASGNTATAYNGIANLGMLYGTPNVPIGRLSYDTYEAMRTEYPDFRTQLLYVASELGGAGRISALAVWVREANNEVLTNFTLRLKHTAASTLYGTTGWDNTGWTTVYRGSPTLASAGWVTFTFTTPFDFNGTGNLVVDWSSDRTTTSGRTTYLAGDYIGAGGMLTGVSDNAHGDPLTWAGNSPSFYVTGWRPAIMLSTVKEIPMRPMQTGAFANGVWSGQVSVPLAGPVLGLRASAGSGLNGVSNALEVAAAPLAGGSAAVFSETFESGVFSSAWTISGNGNYRTQSSTLYSPHGGTRHMIMDATYGTTAGARNEATITLDLAGRNGVTLSFWARGFHDVPQGPPPSPFPATGADFDGVAVSADGGINWYEVLPLRDLAPTDTAYRLDLDSAVAARGLVYGGNFKIRFNQFGNGYAPYDGIAIDDISVTANPLSALSLILPVQGTEGSTGVTGAVGLDAVRTTDTTVSLASSASAKLTVPASVTIPAGQRSVSFLLTLPDDAIVDGDRVVTVSAAAPGIPAVVGSMRVLDDEVGVWTLTTPATASEGAGALQGTIGIRSPLAGNVTVALTSSDPTAAKVPAEITLVPGRTTSTFPITVVEDTKIDGTQITTITASVGSWPAASSVLAVTDNESAALSFSYYLSLTEGQTIPGSVYLSGTLPEDLVVTLVSADPARLTVPATVTIPAGMTNAVFLINAPDNALADGSRAILLTARASGTTLADGATQVQVMDDDVHHFAFTPIATAQATGVPFNVSITAYDATNNVVGAFNGTAALGAAATGGPVTITPATTTAFSGGYWNGNLTATQPGTDVRVTASQGAVSSSSGLFNVTLSPSISITPGNVTASIGQGATANRTITISNTGGGALNWNIGSSAALGTITGGPAFIGQPLSEDKAHAPIPVTSSPYTAPRNAAPIAPPAGFSSIGLASILNNLNANHGLVRTVIPNRYDFSEGETSTGIGDGGGDMYDGGNFLGASDSPGTYLAYSNNVITGTALLGSGGQYFTRKYDGLFVFAADISAQSYFEVTGNLGADGGGQTDTAILSMVRGGVTYRGFVKRVYNAGDPSVNHLIIVADNGVVTHSASTNTNDDQHRVTGLAGVTRLYYLLYAGNGGAYIDNIATQAIMSAFLDAVGTPDWLGASASVGSVGAGASQNVTLTLSAAALGGGNYTRSLAIRSNDPAHPTTLLTVALSVTGGPAIATQPASLTITAGAAAMFAVVSNDPTPLTYRWAKNGVPLADSGGISGSGTATLRIAAASTSDAGSYTVVVSNSMGSVTSAAATLTVTSPPPPPPPIPTPPPPTTSGGGGGGGGGGVIFNPLPVPYAPRITTQPVSRSVVLGGTATFTVVVDALPPATYQWFKSGVAITGATDAILTLPNVDAAAAGNYHVVARNFSDGTPSNIATLQVTAPPPPPVPPAPPSPPAIATGPVAQDVVEGASATFRVAATGTSPLVYQWRRNGVALAGATAPVLTLASARLADAGNYSVLVSNSVGAAISGDAELAVSPAAAIPTITAQPASVRATAGARVSFEVAATGTAPLRFEWRRDGTPIAGATDATLLLAGIQLADAGTYTVIVANAVGDVTSNAATLSLVPVAIPPTIVTQPANESAELGGTATFRVGADGTAPFTYRWHRNGVPISGATNASFRVAAASPANAGSYSVAVANAAGSVTSHAATLTLIPAAAAPVIIENVSDVTTRAGATARFSVLAQGAAPLSYEWRRNGAALPGATGATLELTNVQNDREGLYAVVVTNPLGATISRPAALTVRGRSFAGSYFGSFSGGGSFALQVHDDNTGVFLGFATPTQSALVNRSVTIDEDGHFSFGSNPAATASRIGGVDTAAATVELRVDARIATNGTIAGSVQGLDTTLTGARAADFGGTQQHAGFYQAGAPNASATTYTIVGPAGQAFVLVMTPTATDGGTGSVDASGRLAITTAASTTVNGTLSPSGVLTANLAGTSVPAIDVTGGSQDRGEVEKLLNLSTRNAVGGSAGVLIAGFVINGDAPKPVLVRAIGPTLRAFGLTNALSAARLELFNGATAVASNAAWESAPNAAEVAAVSARTGAFALPAQARDAALLLTLDPGAYTAVVSGDNNAAGIALVEVYDVSLGATAAQKVVNIASRGFAGSGENTLTAGFVVSGTVPKRLLLRGVGPALEAFGVGGVLADPQLLVYRDAAVIASNDNWGDRPDAARSAAAATAVGAFAFPANSKDAALLINLPPGAYTVQVVGTGSATGIALVEVYEVP